ncbi:MAG: cob(I)yrinic acid a,c-diamide adenosyltransferase [Tindallia sp. MSAO_Bac2]|nr:MAG: cob(I)yrinic acid a,c-diamide adenosyltransferase [Tindallia sp. MSAO_Bac2]
MPDKGYVQIYTGNGKGKTTASLGLALRAICSGKKVYMGQFIKGMDYSEMKAPSLLDGLIIEQYGRDCFIKNDPTEEDIRIAKEGLEKIKKIINSGEYDLVILDELNVALYYQLVSVVDVLDIITGKPIKTELVITGRYAPEELIAAADLVTEMKEIKHYYQQGVSARKGIEN